MATVTGQATNPVSPGSEKPNQMPMRGLLDAI